MHGLDQREFGKAWVRSIALSNFRNYENLSLQLDPSHVVLTGHNGAGKTNLLEAVSLLSPGRGLRRSSFDKMLRSDATEWSVFCRVENPSGSAKIGSGYHWVADSLTQSQSSKRRIRIDGESAKSGESLLEYLRISWLTPSMDGLFTGPTSDRRRYLDRLVLAIHPSHGRHVGQFEKLMRSRNKLLAERNPSARWLDGIEIQMAEKAIAISAARCELVELLGNLLGKRSLEGEIFPPAKIFLEGVLEQKIAEQAYSDVEAFYIHALASGRSDDAMAKRTLCGPHRADLKVSHAQKNMDAASCSTGEQKGLLVALLLAHCELISELQAQAPLLLLDEIGAHLDAERRAALFDKIDAIGCVAWITGTDQNLFESLQGRAQFLSVSDGHIEIKP